MKTEKIQAIDGNIEMSKIVLGASNYGSEISIEQSFEIMDKYYELGGRALDTARVYASYIPYGSSKSELAVGKWIKARGVRDEMVIVTKGGHPESRDLHKSRLSWDCLEYDISTSLAVLDMDRVDVYFLHRDDPTVPVSEIMDTLDEFVQRGLARALGASNWSLARIKEANEYAIRNGKTPFTVSQIQWNMAHFNKEDLLDDTCYCMDPNEYAGYRESEIPVMAYSTQAVGFFSKYLKSGESELSFRARMFLNERNIRKTEKVRVLCEKYGCTPAALAIAYITSNPVKGFALIGNLKMEHLLDSLSSIDLELDQETIDWLDKD